MSAKRIAILFFFVLLLFSACGKSGGSKCLSESLLGDFNCKLSVKSETGVLLFAGTLSKANGEYVYALEHPNSIAGARYIMRDGKTVLQIGDMTLPLGGSDIKIKEAFDALSAVSGNENCERVKLYGEDVMKISLDGVELYFLNNKPLLLTFEGARAEITGFTYGKDDNFGNRDQKSVA